MTHGSLSFVCEADNEFPSASKQARLDPEMNSSTPQISSTGTNNRFTRFDNDPVQTPKEKLESPISIFDFDSNVRYLSWPNPIQAREAYTAALHPTIENDSNTISVYMNHQQKLRSSGCTLLSFEDVILPSIFANLNDSLRFLEGKAKGYNDSSAVFAFQYGRMTLPKFLYRSLEAVQQCRSDEAKAEEEHESRMNELRKQQREQERLEKKLKQEQQAKERETAKTLLFMHRQAEIERRKRDLKKNWPRNKELWNEVALLMTDLRRLEKEEKVWKEASEILDKLESESQERIQKIQSSVVQDDGITANSHDDTAFLQDQSLNVDPVLDHCTVSVSRIKCMTESMEILITEADLVRKKLYDSYNNHHKFNGYLGVKDPKALIRALALG